MMYPLRDSCFKDIIGVLLRIIQNKTHTTLQLMSFLARDLVENHLFGELRCSHSFVALYHCDAHREKIISIVTETLLCNVWLKEKDNAAVLH